MQNFKSITGIIRQLSLALLMASCVKPYEVDFDSNQDYVVVEGVLTNELKSHQIQLSYTAGSSDTEIRYVDDASVWVENQSTTIPLIRQGNGIYKTEEDFAGTIGETYQLFIEMADGKIISSNKEVMHSPTKLAAIHQRYAVSPSEDGVTNIGGIQFFIDAEQGELPVNYYRYEWSAGYRIDVTEPAYYKIVTDTVSIDPDSITFTVWPDVEVLLSCYQADSSAGLIYGSTENSTNRQLLDFPVNFVSQESDRLSRRYSLMVKQYTITPGAYYYYKKLDETNNYGGSLFDRQTGRISGNLSYENSNDPVMGYFEVASVDSLREFFNRSDFDRRIELPNYYFYCQDTLLAHTDTLAIVYEFIHSQLSPVYITQYDGSLGIMNLQTVQFCSDCSYYADPEPPIYWIP
jgi:hypothetical protein